jgi:ADP-ribose pyrophosphatase YjhB (NUDIX family)
MLMDTAPVAVRAVCGVVALDTEGRFLLVRRADDGSWGLPGGGVEPGESWSDAALRECTEETGWLVRITGLFGAYSDPHSQMHVYPDGQGVHFFGVVLAAEVVEQVGRPDDEVVAVGFFAPQDLPEPMFGPDRPVLMDFVSQSSTPVIA